VDEEEVKWGSLSPGTCLRYPVNLGVSGFQLVSGTMFPVNYLKTEESSSQGFCQILGDGKK